MEDDVEAYNRDWAYKWDQGMTDVELYNKRFAYKIPASLLASVGTGQKQVRRKSTSKRNERRTTGPVSKPLEARVWNDVYCPPSSALTITDFRKTACRTSSSQGKNPCLPTSLPFTRDDPTISVKINNPGSWIAIGVADIRTVQTNGGSPLGTQNAGYNCAYFNQKGRAKIIGVPKPSGNLPPAPPINVGDYISITADFSTNDLIFFNNDTPIATLPIPRDSLSLTSTFAHFVVGFGANADVSLARK